MKIRKIFNIFGERKSPLEKALFEAYSSNPALIPSTRKVISFVSRLNEFNGTQKELVDRVIQEFNVSADSGDYLDNVQNRSVVSFKYVGEDLEGNILSRKVMLRGKTPIIEGLTPKEVKVLAATQLLIENSTAPLIGYDCFKEILKQSNSVIPFDFGEYFEFGDSCVEGVISVKAPNSQVVPKKQKNLSGIAKTGLVGSLALAAFLGITGLYSPLLDNSRSAFNRVNFSRLEKKLIQEAEICPFEIQPVFKEDKSSAKVVTDEKELMGMPWDTYSNSFKFEHRDDFNLSCVSKIAFAYVSSGKISELDTYIVFSFNNNSPTSRLGLSKYLEIYKFNKDSRNWEEKELRKTDSTFVTFCSGRVLDSDNYSIVAIPVTRKEMSAQYPLEIYTFNSDGSLKKEKTNLKLSGGDILALDIVSDEKGLDEILFSEYRSNFRIGRLFRDANEEVQIVDLKTSLIGLNREERYEEGKSPGCFIPHVFFRNISDFSNSSKKRILIGSGTDSNLDYKFLFLDAISVNSDEVILSNCKNSFNADNSAPIYSSLNISEKSLSKPVGMVWSNYGTPFVWVANTSASFPVKIFDAPYQDRRVLDNVNYITSGVVDGIPAIAVSTNLRAMIGYARDIKKK